MKKPPFIRAPTALALLGSLLIVGQALGDGKGFPSRAAEDPVQTTDQRAVVVWEDGRQKLVLETGLESESDSIGWVIPVPSPPEVRPATRGLFPALEHFFAPRLKEDVPSKWIALNLLVIAGLVALWIARLIRFGVLILAGMLPLLFVAGLLLPALSALSGSPPAGSGVAVRDRQTVGDYDVTIIEGDSADALLNWLEDNGYVVNEGSRPVIADYVSREWVFVAAQLKRDEGNGTKMNPHPLELTFDSKRCVYPMALTRVAQENPIEVELFVFADRQATADNLQTRSTLEVERGEFRDDDSFARFPQVGTRIDLRHPYLTELLGLKSGGPYVATRLYATLRPQAMKSDLELGFKAPRLQREERYTQQAISGYSLIAACALLGPGLLVGAVRARRRHPAALDRCLPYILGATLLGTAATYGYCSQKKGTPSQGGFDRIWKIHQQVAAILDDAEASSDPEAIDAGWVRRTLKKRWDTAIGEPTATLPTPQELDVPGHYTIDRDSDRLTVWTYDQTGSRHLAWREEER